MPSSVDPRFPDRLRQLLDDRGVSYRVLAARTFYGKSYVHDLAHGRKTPNRDAAQRIDDALSARGELAAMVTETRASDWETSELLARVHASDTSLATIEALHNTAVELCCSYSWRDAADLRSDSLRWLREVIRLRDSAGLRAHRELLAIAGWLGLLVGCVEYDLGMRTAADATRAAALTLGEESGSTEIMGWAWEMAAWFALTQGQLRQAIDAARTGQAVVGEAHTVVVQLAGLEAKALARTGDALGVRVALERGQAQLHGFAPSERPDNHFVVDPDKWDFLSMDAYRLAGDYELAERHAHQVLKLGTMADGRERKPMRMAEARLTLGVAAARAGDLEKAVSLGAEAFKADRRSLPSLLMVGGELDAELWRRYPREPSTVEFRAILRAQQAA
jgi:tetratricopeptide (TPR) repeat protein